MSCPSLKITIRLPDAFEKVERAEEPRRLLDGLDDDGALVGEALPFVSRGDEPHAEQHVLVVGRERRDDVGFVAELDERDQVAVLPLHAQLHEVLRRCDGREIRLRTLGVQLRRQERLIHARGSVDHDGDPAARVRRFGVGERGVGIGEGQREERHAGEKDQQRRMTHARPTRAAHRRQTAPAGSRARRARRSPTAQQQPDARAASSRTSTVTATAV